MPTNPPLPPILVADLFPTISDRLLELLRSLEPAEWHLPTSSSRRMVKDVASHLLDGSLRRLSMQRDRYRSPDRNDGLRDEESLVEFLNRLNADWDRATRRLSPQVLIELIEWADAGVAALFQSLDPWGTAIFPVAWAGELHSPNWMDVAREFTEKWHHTQQIFEATGRESTIVERRLMNPCLETFLRALPWTYQDFDAADGSTLAIDVTGEAGGTWHLERTSDGWQQVPSARRTPHATVTLSALDLWRLVTKRRPTAEVRQLLPAIRIDGDHDLADRFLTMTSMMV